LTHEVQAHLLQGKALVLGGGGVVGIAWMTGLLFGLAECDVNLGDADTIIGTSAGATVAAQIGSDLSFADLFARQVDPEQQSQELVPEPGALERVLRTFDQAAMCDDPIDRARQVGRLALDTTTVAEWTRRAVIADRLPAHDWPSRRITLVAIDAENGVARMFERDSGTSLTDAVAASCAVPGIWPPVTIDGRSYMDGGVRSSDNADLARGHARIIVVSPMGQAAPSARGNGLLDQIRVLEASGAKVFTITADDDARAIIGPDPLAIGRRPAAADAGRHQGRRTAPILKKFWVC